MSESGYLIVIHPDSSIEVVESPGGAEDIHRLVGGYFENVYLPDFPVSDVVASVNDVGKLIGLPMNPLATFIYRNPLDLLLVISSYRSWSVSVNITSLIRSRLPRVKRKLLLTFSRCIKNVG